MTTTPDPECERSSAALCRMTVNGQPCQRVNQHHGDCSPDPVGERTARLTYPVTPRIGGSSGTIALLIPSSPTNTGWRAAYPQKPRP